MLPSSGESFPHLIRKRRSQLEICNLLTELPSYDHRLRRIPYQSRKANTERPLHKNLERSIWKQCKCPPHKTIYTHHLPQTFPFCMAQLPSPSVPNKSRQLPFIPSQNEQDALSKLQLPWKDHTNGPPPYAGMQLMVKRPPVNSQISPPTSGSAVPHKHRQHRELPQTYLPSTSRRCPRKLTFWHRSFTFKF